MRAGMINIESRIRMYHDAPSIALMVTGRCRHTEDDMRMRKSMPISFLVYRRERLLILIIPRRVKD